MSDLSKIVITGAGGYLGGRFVSHFLKKGFSVVALSRSKRPENFSTLVHHQNLIWLNLDLAVNNRELCSALENADALVHAAGVDAQRAVSDPVEAFAFNAGVTSVIAEVAALVNVRRFIYLSTTHVYPISDFPEVMFSETSYRFNSHPYGLSNLAGEKSVHWAANGTELESIALRLSNSFGPPMTANRAGRNLIWNSFIRQAIIDKKIVMSGNINHWRQYIAISELCRIIQILVGIRIPDRHCTYNLAPKKIMSNINVAEAIRDFVYQELGFYAEIVAKPEKEGPKNFIDSSSIEALGLDISESIESELGLLYSHEEKLIFGC